MGGGDRGREKEPESQGKRRRMVVGVGVGGGVGEEEKGNKGEKDGRGKGGRARGEEAAPALTGAPKQAANPAAAPQVTKSRRSRSSCLSSSDSCMSLRIRVSLMMLAMMEPM